MNNSNYNEKSDSRIINSQELLLKVFTNINENQLKEQNSITNAWKKITTSIKNPTSTEDIGEKLYSHSTLIDVKDGILLIETDHPGFIQLFRIYQKYILNGLKRFVPELEIKNLSFRLSGSKFALADKENVQKNAEKQNLENSFKIQEKAIEEIYEKSPKFEKNNEIPEKMTKVFERMKKSLLTK